jgi:hypothetical protein
MGAAVLVIAAVWCLAGCSSPTNSSSGNPAQEAADAFKTTHAAVLDKTVDTVAVPDEAVVDAALTAYNALDADVKALLETEKTLLNSLKAKIDELIAGETAQEAANAFKAAHTAALGKTVDTVATTDETAVDAALAAYNALDANVKALLGPEKTLLDSLKTKLQNLGTASFIILNDEGNLVSNISGDVHISKGSKEVFSITAAEDLTNIRWSLNGTAIPDTRGNAREIAFEAVSYLVGSYTVSLYAEKAGIPYLFNAAFVVEN